MGHLGPFTLVLVLEGVLSRRFSYGLPLLLHNGMSVHPPQLETAITHRATQVLPIFRCVLLAEALAVAMVPQVRCASPIN